MERIGLRDLGMVASVAGIQIGDDLPRDIGHRVPACDCARQVDLDGVDEGDVVHDLAHRPTVGRRRRDSPFRVRQPLDKRGQAGGAFFDTIGKQLRAMAHSIPPWGVW